jgi:hypothetical protein
MSTFLLAGCATKFSAQVPPGRIKSVAIFSELPNRISLSYRGLTVLNNQRVHVDGDFGFNDLVLADLRKFLAPQYQIVPMTLGKLVPDKASNEDDQVRKTSEHLRAVAKPGEVDAIILAAPMFGVQGDEALGAFWGSQDTDPKNTAGVSWILEVFDGRTFERIAYSHVMPPPFVDFRWSGEPYDKLPDSAKAQLQETLKRSVEGSIPMKLRECGLLS